MPTSQKRRSSMAAISHVRSANASSWAPTAGLLRIAMPSTIASGGDREMAMRTLRSRSSSPRRARTSSRYVRTSGVCLASNVRRATLAEHYARGDSVRAESDAGVKERVTNAFSRPFGLSPSEAQGPPQLEQGLRQRQRVAGRDDHQRTTGIQDPADNGNRGRKTRATMDAEAEGRLEPAPRSGSRIGRERTMSRMSAVAASMVRRRPPDRTARSPQRSIAIDSRPPRGAGQFAAAAPKPVRRRGNRSHALLWLAGTFSRSVHAVECAADPM